MLRRYKTQIQMLGALLLGVALTMGTVAWRGHMERLVKIEGLIMAHDQHIAANGKVLMDALKKPGMPLDLLKAQTAPQPAPAPAPAPPPVPVEAPTPVPGGGGSEDAGGSDG